MKLGDKVVVITGSGSGIGEAFARRFAAEGARVVVADRNGASVDRVSSGVGCAGIQADVTREEEVQAIANLAERTYGPVDVWFSNAGFDGPRREGDLRENADWELSWYLHVMSHVYAVRAVLPSMLKRGDGYLIQTASMVALATDPGNPAYAVTKHGALALAEWLAATYRPKGVKVSCFCPGPMLTPMLLAHQFPAYSPAMLIAKTPADIAEVLVHGIDAERFLIVESDPGTQQLAAKAGDYEKWIVDMSAVSAELTRKR
jgi:NAD(P)-dependent dehydrogenase (short-subunit alcohol dehydrogenase family)